MQIEKLFPTPIGFFQYDQKLSGTELDFILNLERRPNVGNQTSVNSYILENEILKNLKTFFELSLSKFIDEVYKPENKIFPYITQSWANFTQPQGHHHKHNHQNSLISGVFYVKLSKMAGRITFTENSHQLLYMKPREYNEFNSESWTYQVTENVLILFPSYLNHEVPNFVGDDERISISFNTFVRGQIGSNDDLNEIIL